MCIQTIQVQQAARMTNDSWFLRWCNNDLKLLWKYLYFSMVFDENFGSPSIFLHDAFGRQFIIVIIRQRLRDRTQSLQLCYVIAFQNVVTKSK